MSTSLWTVQEESDDEADGEVVEERGMFHRCYKGHCNLSQNREVCFTVASAPKFAVAKTFQGNALQVVGASGRAGLQSADHAYCTPCMSAHIQSHRTILHYNVSDTAMSCT